MLKSIRSSLVFLLIVSSALGGAVHPVKSAASLVDSVYFPILFNQFDTIWDFKDPIRVILFPVPYTDPYLVIDSTGRVHLLWDTASGDQSEIYHSVLSGREWSLPTRVADTTGVSRLLTSPAVGNQGSLYFVWYNELNPNGPYRILYAAWNGTHWGPGYEVLNQGQSTDINAVVRLDRQGVPNILYFDPEDPSVAGIYYRKWTGAGFTTSQRVKKPIYSSLVWLDQDNGLRFYGNENNRVYFSYWKNGAFVENNRTTSGSIQDRQTFLDGQNHLHLIQQIPVDVPGGSVTGLEHQCLKSDLTWTHESILTGQEGIETYRLSFNEQMQLILSWSKNNNQSVGMTLWNGCNLTKQKELALPVVPYSYGWGDFITTAENSQAGKICFLSKEKESYNTFWLTCNR